MKIMSASALLVLTVLFIGSFIPEASAKRCRSSFGLSFNAGGPSYVVAPAPAPAPVVAAPVYPAYPGYVPGTVYYGAPVYGGPVYGAPVYGAPVYGAPVVVERPAYVQPGFSFSYRNRR